MKVWYNTSFKGHYPVGTCAVAVAETAQEASDEINKVLPDYGLEPTSKPEDMEEVIINDIPYATVLLDGDY